MRDWKEYKLSDFAQINPRETLKKGTLAKKIAMDALEPFTRNIKSFEIEEYKGGVKFRNGDTLMARITPSLENGKTSYVDILENDEVGFGSTEFIVFRENKEISDKKFIYYLSISPEVREIAILSMTGSSGRQRVQTDVLKEFIFEAPPLPEQKAIASVLSSLDDKIDLLHQQNQTLEALAETLYLNFIGEREFNSKLSDIFSLQNGYAFKSKSFKESGTIRVIKIKNISGDIVDITNSDFVDDESIKKLDVKFKINSGDILIAMTGAEVGKLGIVPETDQSLWLNQRVGSIKQKFEGAKYLAYLHLKSDFGQDYIENTATGSAQPNISGEGIENCEFPLYEEAELEEICNKLSPLYDKVIFNLGQIQTLTQLRDTLLPKLMSGEVRVKM